MVSKLYITQANYIWVVKGYHIFGLKYDAFHGGEMILDKTIKIEWFVKILVKMKNNKCFQEILIVTKLLKDFT